MVDFNKKITNTDKFRQAALFFKEHNCYTLAPRGTTDYTQYWDQETERCINGYIAPDGDSITGYHYFYLNYSPIIKRTDTKYTDRFGNVRTRRERVLDFPDFHQQDNTGSFYLSCTPGNTNYYLHALWVTTTASDCDIATDKNRTIGMLCRPILA